jgi:hypothetical protein
MRWSLDSSEIAAFYVSAIAAWELVLFGVARWRSVPILRGGR